MRTRPIPHGHRTILGEHDLENRLKSTLIDRRYSRIFERLRFSWLGEYGSAPILSFMWISRSFVYRQLTNINAKEPFLSYGFRIKKTIIEKKSNTAVNLPNPRKYDQ
jgi:hypothetical protein